VKTFALSSLLLFVAYAGIARYGAKYPKRVFALGGLLLGLSADARLYFAGLLPLLMLWIFIAPEIRERRVFDERRGREIEQPRCDNAAAPPHFGDGGQIEIVLIMFRVPERRRLGIVSGRG